jgi:hypothetical protein
MGIFQDYFAFDIIYLHGFECVSARLHIWALEKLVYSRFLDYETLQSLEVNKRYHICRISGICLAKNCTERLLKNSRMKECNFPKL